MGSDGEDEGWASGVDNEDVSGSAAVVAIERAIQEHLTPVVAALLRLPSSDYAEPYSNHFRREFMYTQAVDEVCRRCDSITRKAYTKYMSTETGFMMVDGWLAFLKALGMFNGGMLARCGVKPVNAVAEAFSGIESGDRRSRTLSVGSRRSSPSPTSRGGRSGSLIEPRKPSAPPPEGLTAAAPPAVSRTARLRTLKAGPAGPTKRGLPALQIPTGDDSSASVSVVNTAPSTPVSPMSPARHSLAPSSPLKLASEVSTASAAVTVARATAEWTAARTDFNEVSVVQEGTLLPQSFLLTRRTKN
jgi:hypothetical protein